MWRKPLSQSCNTIFFIQPDQSSFGSSNILIAYLRSNSPSLKCIDEFLFAKNLRADSNGETIMPCLEDYRNTQSVAMENITGIH